MSSAPQQFASLVIEGSPGQGALPALLGVIANWFSDGDAIHVLTAQPHNDCPICGEVHAWFVNREGRTLCVQCDSDRAAQQGEKLRARLRMSACEAFRIFRGQNA